MRSVGWKMDCLASDSSEQGDVVEFIQEFLLGWVDIVALKEPLLAPSLGLPVADTGVT